jgi:hypothetical protein
VSYTLLTAGLKPVIPERYFEYWCYIVNTFITN